MKTERRSPRGVAIAAAIASTLVAGGASAQPAEHMDLTGRVDPPVVNAYVLASASDAVYLDEGTSRRGWFAELGFRETSFISEDGEENTQVSIIETDDVLAVVVRGTEELLSEDAWTDAQVQQVEPSWRDDIQIHNGFLKSANEVYARIIPHVRRANDAGKAVFFAGHSLGGAVIHVLALRTSLAGEAITGVYTYGAPDLGNGDFVELYNRRLGAVTARIVNGDDPMPCRPRLWWYDGVARNYQLWSGSLTPMSEPDCPTWGSADDFHGIAKYTANLRTLVPEKVWRRPAVTFDIHDGALRGDLGPELWRETTWSDGWSSIVPYRIGNKYFVALHKAEDGRLDLRRMSSDGTLGGLVESRPGYAPGALITAVTTAGRSSLLVTRSTGRVSRIPLTDDGNLCIASGCPATPSFEVGVTIGGFSYHLFTNVAVGEVGGKQFLLHLSRITGDVVVHELSGAAFGVRRLREDWTSGWSSAGFFSSGAKTYLFLLKEDTGQAHVHELRADGTIGARLHYYDWTRGWTSAVPYQVDGYPFLLLLKGSTGDLQLRPFNEDASVAAPIEVRNWTSGWLTTAIVPYGPFDRVLFAIKR